MHHYLHKITLRSSAFYTVNIIPADIDQFFYINTIDIIEQKIKIIPYELTNLSNLSYIALSFNIIEIIPSYINNLKKLKQLYLGWNFIKNIPTEIYDLSLLEKLSFRHCPTEHFPPGVSKLKNLILIDVGNLTIIEDNMPYDLCTTNILYIYHGYHESYGRRLVY